MAVSVPDGFIEGLVTERYCLCTWIIDCRGSALQTNSSSVNDVTGYQ